MAITVEEAYKSRPTKDGETQTVDRQYWVKGTADHDAALGALASESPASDGSLIRLDYGVEPVHINTADTGSCVWRGVARYGVPSGSAPQPLAKGEVRITGSTLGGRQHTTTALATTGYGSGGAAVPPAHGVGDDGRGHVAGVDIVVPQAHYEITKVYTDAGSAPTFDAIEALVGSVNEGTFTVEDSQTGRDFSAAEGECLLLGHREGPTRVDGGLEITYEFARAPNRSGISLPNNITVTSKAGHEYLWSRYAEASDLTTHRLYAQMIAAYVSQVYRLADWTPLDVGTIT